MKQKYIIINNYEKYQHYSDRKIVWIKLYTDILQDYKIRQLSMTARWIFIGMLVVGSKHGNRVPYDLTFIRSQIGDEHTSKKVINKHIKQLECLALIKISDSLDIEEKRIDKNRIEENTDDSNANFISSKQRLEIGKKYINLDLEEEWDKFTDYNRDVRKSPIKSLSMAWRNWLKKAEEFRQQSPQAITERENQATMQQQKNRENQKGRPIPESLRKQRDALIKKKSIPI